MPDVVFDSWAWVEVLEGTAVGKGLWRKYGESGSVHTSAIGLAEVGSKALRQYGDASKTDAIVRRIETASVMHAVEPEDATCGVRTHVELRKRAKDASLADAIHLCTAQRLGFTLISGDPAFRGRKDVRRT